MKKIILLAFVLSIVMATPAMSAISGYTLRSYCQDALKYIENKDDPTVANKSKYKKCFAVVAETLKKGSGDLYCIPPEKTYADLIIILMEFFDENRELLTRESTSLIDDAAIRIFPCPEPTPEKDDSSSNPEKENQ